VSKEKAIEIAKRKINRLKSLVVDEVSLVDNPAVPGAKFILFKSDESIALKDLVETLHSVKEVIVDLESKDIGKQDAGDLLKVAKDLASSLAAFIQEIEGDPQPKSTNEEGSSSGQFKSFLALPLIEKFFNKKTKTTVNYRTVDKDAAESCKGCRFFMDGDAVFEVNSGNAICNLAEGTVLGGDLCNLFEARGTVAKSDEEGIDMLEARLKIVNSLIMSIFSDDIEKVGKVISGKNEKRISSAMTSMASAVDSLKNILSEAGIEVEKILKRDDLNDVWTLLLQGRFDDSLTKLGIILNKDVKKIAGEVGLAHKEIIKKVGEFPRDGHMPQAGLTTKQDIVNKALAAGEIDYMEPFADSYLIKTNANSQLIKESFQKIAKIK